MKKQLLIIFIILIEILTLSKSASAYLFPGTGAAIIGSMWPFIIAFFMAICAFLVKIFWRPIKKGVSKIVKRKNKEEQTLNEGEETLLKSPKLQ